MLRQICEGGVLFHVVSVEVGTEIVKKYEHEDVFDSDFVEVDVSGVGEGPGAAQQGVPVGR